MRFEYSPRGKPLLPIRLSLGNIAFCCIVVLCGCGRKSEIASSETTSNFPLPKNPAVAQCEPGVRGGRLVIADFGMPKTFNPVTANEGSSDDIIRFLFSGLTMIDAPTQKVL